MFNPEKVVTIIKHVSEQLDKQNTYRLGVDLLKSELTELRKHFNVELAQGFGGFEDTYIFTNKNPDA